MKYEMKEANLFQLFMIRPSDFMAFSQWKKVL